MQRIETCDRCQRKFIRKFVSPRNDWSQLNEVSYWTEGKVWNGYKLLCRRCLKDWKDKHRDDFLKLVSLKKRTKFTTYRIEGVFDKEDLE